MMYNISEIYTSIYQWWNQLDRDWKSVVYGLSFLTLALFDISIPW